MSPTLEAESSGAEVLGKAVSDLQEDVVVGEDTITGTLKYVTGYTGFSGDPALQEGNYLALSYANGIPTGCTSLKIGLTPSSTGMTPVECINDPDHNIVLKISNNRQKIKMIYTNGTETETKFYKLNLTLEQPTE